MSSSLDLGLFSRSRVRLVRQTEVAECGLASLAMVAGFHGLDIDLASLRRRFQPSLRGASLRSLTTIADAIGLTARPVKLPLDQISNLHMPAILHWDLNHYVVVEQVRRGRALIHNPDGSSRWYGSEELSRHFTGVAVELRPADDFERGSSRERLRLSQIWGRMSGFKRSLVQTLVLSLIMQGFVLASPYYMQVALDSALPALDADLLLVLAFGFGMFTLLNVAASLLRQFVLLTAGSSLSYGIASNIARRMFRLPVDWFERRHVGDVLSRFGSIQPIQKVLTEGAVAALLDGVLAVLILGLMFFYSPLLTFVALTAFLLYAAVRAISFSLLREAKEAAIVAAAREQSTMIESVRGIVTLRLFNREAQRHAVWQGRLTESVNASVGVARIGAWQQTANTAIFGIETIVAVWLAVGFVMGGGFSVGMVFAYIAYKTQFLQRGASLIDQFIEFRMLGLHLERLSDIALTDQDKSFRKSDLRAAPAPLKGAIALKGIGFRYSPSDPLILDGLDLDVGPGEHVAITGPSGGGKSTLIKILLGLIEPECGEVLIDGTPLDRYGHKNYHDQIAAVLQDDHLFAGSLAENIALFDEAPDMQRIVEAAAAAAIHSEIMAMPMGYETLVGDMGSSLSGGQKQRVLLARALYRKPRVIVIDEGTSHLDPHLERQVNAAVSALGITRIIVAHRAETIRAAEQVYVADRGRLVKVALPPVPAPVPAAPSAAGSIPAAAGTAAPTEEPVA